jgi:hypothetical protein
MNWQDITWVQWAQGIATVIVAVLGFFIKRQVTQLHVTINSKMDSLLDLTRKASKAEGKEEERNEQLVRESQQALGMKAGRDQDAAAMQMTAAKTQEAAADVQLEAAKKVGGAETPAPPPIPRGSITP